ncbi:ribosomal protein S5 domain 2-type protein [Suillus paluster]|uniref:ribosomal protein S5 domain 2-type protein n=1 Tax=Suillus paluster TaxID=48578 RepID=UPI001B861F94|nr:ribosomal protein S5 domain 2-type protein [Suillus paluster]KAG1722690.1 ribosomal protein S5 domain 2-type protein [Suillus paluster]
MSSSSTANPSAADETLRAQIFQRLHPRVYLERFIAEKIRPDGRTFDEWRNVSVNVGSISTADGSALVRMGDTTIVCGVKAEIAEPELDRPDQGFLVPNIDLPAICSPKFKPGPPTEEAQVLSDRLNEALVASGALSLDSLCIHPGKAVWTLYVDCTCINYDGNAFDAALVAMLGALRNTTLPKATYDDETGRTTCSRKTRSPLLLNRNFASTSFGVLDKSHVLSDPTAFEEPLMDVTLTVIVDERGELISTMESGGAISEETLLQCISRAKERALQLQKLF